MPSLINQIWDEKYRPRRIADCVLPEPIKARLQSFVDTGTLPHLFLTGSAGIGKTTVARAIVHELGAEFLLVNASLHGNIDNLRTSITEFATSISFQGNRKFVILDEADYMNPTSTQPALRAFMQEFASNCGFILTANYPERVIPELHSRCSVISFALEDLAVAFRELAPAFIRRVVMILETEGVPFLLPVLVAFIRKRFPDFRKSLIDLQGYAAERGEINAGILSIPTPVDSLIAALRERAFEKYEHWLLTHTSVIDSGMIYRLLYDNRNKICPIAQYPALIERLALYQFQHASVADRYINALACLSSIAEGVVHD
jgi:DNA polymerase III delta prime subunit